MKKVTFLIIILFFSNSWGDIEKKAWRETGYKLHHFFSALSDRGFSCYDSEKLFGACLMALQRLILFTGDEFYQLRVSDSNTLEIVPSPEESRPKTEQDMIEFFRQNRESFHLLFQRSPPGPEELNKLFHEIRLLAEEKIPEKDQSFHAGRAHDFFLKETHDSHTSLIPKALTENTFERIGFGFGILNYQTNDETLNGSYVIETFKDLPAYNAGLRKGDLILAIDGIDIRGLPFEEVDKIINVPAGTRVNFTVQSFCDNKKREVPVVPALLSVSNATFFEKKHQFVNINREEAPDCPSIKKTEDKPPTQQAFYLSLHTFSNITCEEFVGLQTKDLSNPLSLGMIIDLRNNKGGELPLVICMLESLIYSTDILLSLIPVHRGEVLLNDDPRKILFPALRYLSASLDFDFQPDKDLIPLPVYNKNIVVLVNKDSASVSEFFAGTIQDMKRGWVVGERTTGKGSLQVEDLFDLDLESDQSISYKPLIQTTTQWIYTLNSGRSPQITGIIPDFQFSRTGEAIAHDPDSISRKVSLLNPIPFENKTWEQNRPIEKAELESCIHQDGKMGKNLKKRIREEEKYNRPFINDYHLELAKDILSCLPPRELFMSIPKPGQ